MRLVIRPQQRRHPPIRKLNIQALEDRVTCTSFRGKMAKFLAKTQEDYSIEAKWQHLLSDLSQAAADTIGYKKHKDQDWCDKVCGSRIGLNSHLRWHQRNHL
ncbi:hypothetical protein Pcinc_011768 [Petrolisthes cinctipes]|uniref:C2H2-type domain-containing protein n=1 Tax=Petrolisthes cinctipes TaxID=88211 RepID=A0AAE1KU41_PETCI|nr:hypothetical protein Pcinc_011768 [Petrolisthes cinctipes]